MRGVRRYAGRSFTGENGDCGSDQASINAAAPTHAAVAARTRAAGSRGRQRSDASMRRSSAAHPRIAAGYATATGAHE